MNKKIKESEHNVNFKIKIMTYKIYITNNYSIIFIQKYKLFKIYFAGLMFIMDI